MLILRSKNVVWVPLKIVNQGYSKELKTVSQCWTCKNTKKQTSVLLSSQYLTLQKRLENKKIKNIIKVVFKNAEIPTRQTF